VIPVLIETLLLASAGILSFGSITLVILMLISNRGWVNGLAYALGYTCAYTAIGVAAVLVGYRSSGGARSEPGIVFPFFLLILGLLLLWMGWSNQRKAPDEDTGASRFFAIVDSITPIRALGFGAAVTVINFKNLALFLTALSVVILSPLPLAERVAVALLAALVFSLSVLIPVVIYLVLPRRANRLLNAFKSALERHNRAIGIWAPLLFGLIFMVKAVSDLL